MLEILFTKRYFRRTRHSEQRDRGHVTNYDSLISNTKERTNLLINFVTKQGNVHACWAEITLILSHTYIFSYALSMVIFTKALKNER